MFKQQGLHSAVSLDLEFCSVTTSYFLMLPPSLSLSLSVSLSLCVSLSHSFSLYVCVVRACVNMCVCVRARGIIRV